MAAANRKNSPAAGMDGVMDNLIKPFPYYQRIRFFWGNYQKDFPCLLYLGTTETAMVLTDSTDHGNGPLAVAVWKESIYTEGHVPKGE